MQCLGRYEDTGLSPEQIREIDRLYQELSREAATLRERQRWIPVEERQPEESLNSVIGWDEYKERCCFVQYYLGQWHSGSNEPVKVIAWMPLPEPYCLGDEVN